MKDFRLRNDTVLLFRNEPVNDIMNLAAGKKVLFVYGGASVRQNGCYDDVKSAVSAGKGELYELGGASRELKDIETEPALWTVRNSLHPVHFMRRICGIVRDDLDAAYH